MDSNRNPHEHVLGTLYNFAIDFEQVATLQCFESEVVVVEIAIINDLRVEKIRLLANDFNDIRSHQRGVFLGDWIDIVVQVFHRFSEGLLGGLMKIGKRNSACKTGIVRVRNRIGGGYFSSKIVQFRCCNTVVDALNYAHGNFHRIHGRVQFVAKFFNSCCDLVELNGLLASVSF